MSVMPGDDWTANLSIPGINSRPETELDRAQSKLDPSRTDSKLNVVVINNFLLASSANTK
jgi:hypothetical protein